MHRAMHPWKTTSIPDIGKFLYKQVHSLHHKSYNPTAFSGTNMHPVEATLYYSAALIPAVFGLHPIHSLGEDDVVSDHIKLILSRCHH